MRSLALALIFFLAALDPACSQKLEDITSISLTKETRGFLDEVVISGDSVRGVIENYRMPEHSRHYSAGIDDEEWSKLIMTLKDVSLEDIDGLQSPTMDRARDAAVHSSIVITFKNGDSVTHSFDDEKPHEDLAPLLKAIMEFHIPDGLR